MNTDKKLGVLGGMGPAAGAEFCKLLAAKAPALKDQEHPVVYMLSDAKIPDRTEFIQGRGEDPTERLRAGLLTLSSWGADFLAVPCNTAHLFIDTFRGELTAPLIHIVEETLKVCMAKSPGGAWLLATKGTYQSGLYQKYAIKAGYRLYETDSALLDDVQKCVGFVKGGKPKDAAELMRGVASALWKTRELPLATACTELPLAYESAGLPSEKSVSSLDALADACIKAIYNL